MNVRKGFEGLRASFLTLGLVGLALSALRVILFRRFQDRPLRLIGNYLLFALYDYDVFRRNL